MDGRFRLPGVVRAAREDLDDHSESLFVARYNDLRIAERAGENQIVALSACVATISSKLGSRRRRAGSLAIFGEEAGVDALVVERFDQLPHQPADRGDSKVP